MEESDNIKKLFKERFESFEAPVDPKLWSGIESAISGSAPIAGASILSTKAIISLVVAATVVATIATISLTDGVKDRNINTPIAIENEIIERNTISDENIENVLSVEGDDSNNRITPVEPEVSNGSVTMEKKDSNNDLIRNTSKNNELAEVESGKEESLVEEVNSQEIRSEVSISDVNKDTEIISNAPKTIIVKDQSRVEAYPSGGVAPLFVTFSSIAEIQDIKWKFDDGTESTALNPTHEFTEPGIYFVTMLAKLKDGSVVMDKAVIQVKEDLREKENSYAVSEIKVHNIITPNGDGSNDELIVEMKGIHSYSISIYSKGGQLVYQSENPMQNWDGTNLNGSRVLDGTYFYLINALGEDQKVYSPKGYITVRGSR